jgi:hypothetical protein
LIKSNKKHKIVCKSNRPEEDCWLLPAYCGCKNRAYKVSHNRQMCGRIGNLGEASVTSREPLAIDFELQRNNWSHKHTPHCRMYGLCKTWWNSECKKHPSDPRSEEKIYTHRMLEFSPYCFKEVGRFQYVDEEDDHKRKDRKAP